MKGDVQSERKNWFFFGSQQQLNKLKHMSGYGPIGCDTQVFYFFFVFLQNCFTLLAQTFFYFATSVALKDSEKLFCYHFNEMKC